MNDTDNTTQEDDSGRKVRLDASLVLGALNSMEQMLRDGEWYCAEERVHSLREALQHPETWSEVVVTTNIKGECVAVTRQDPEGRILSVIWESSSTEPESDDTLLDLFRKHYPNYAALVEMSKKGRDYTIDSIAALRSYTAFKHGYQEAKA